MIRLIRNIIGEHIAATITVEGDLRRGVPFPGTFTRWMGSAEVFRRGRHVAYLKACGDFLELHVKTNDALVGPLYFEEKDRAIRFLARVSPWRLRYPDATDVALRYLMARNRCRASINVIVTDGSVLVTLAPPADLDGKLTPDAWPRTPISMRDAYDWLSEANMMARVRDIGDWAPDLSEFMLNEMNGCGK